MQVQLKAKEKIDYLTPEKDIQNDSRNEEEKVQVVQLTPMSDPTSSSNMSEIMNKLGTVNTSGHPSANHSNNSTPKHK